MNIKRGPIILIILALCGTIFLWSTDPVLSINPPNVSTFRSPLVETGWTSQVDNDPPYNCPHYGDGWMMDVNIGIGDSDLGTPVYAVGAGRIVSAQWEGSASYGWSAILESEGVYFRYAHLLLLNVHEGKNVSAGELIGLLGTSGESTSPHLHFEAYTLDSKGNLVDYPMDNASWFTDPTSNCNNSMSDANIAGELMPGNDSLNCTGYENSWNYFWSQGLKPVALFDHDSCVGNILELPDIGIYRLDWYNFNDRTRSIVVPEGRSVILRANVESNAIQSSCITGSYSNLDTIQYEGTSINIGLDEYFGQQTDRDYTTNGYNMVSEVVVFDNPACSGVWPTYYIGGSSYLWQNQSTTPSWLNELSFTENPPLEMDIRVKCDASDPNVFDSCRVLIDGNEIFQTSASDYTHTWNTYGVDDGFHTVEVQYLLDSHNGNWTNALNFDELEIYLSPNRGPYANCDGGNGITLTSNGECIRITESVGDFMPVGWSNRNSVTACVVGDYTAWLYDGVQDPHGNYQGIPKVVTSGNCMAVGNNISSVDLKDAIASPPSNPWDEFNEDTDTVYHMTMNSNANDSAGGLTASVGSGVTPITGKFGNGYYFPNPTDGAGLTYPAINVCPMTFEAWANRGTGDTFRIAGQAGRWILSVDGNKPRIEVWHDTGSMWVTGYQTMAENTWHYLMWTYNCDDQVLLYMDQELVGSFTLDNSWSSTANALEIGAVEGIYRMNGYVDEVRISNIVRVPEEPEGSPSPTPTPTPTPTTTPSPTPTATPQPATANLDFSSGLNITNANNDTSRDIRAALSPDGTIHTVYTQKLNGQYEVYYQYKDESGWSDPELVAQTGVWSGAPSIEVTSDNVVHVVWFNQTSNIRTYYASKSPGGSWSSPTDLVGSTNFSSYNPSIIADSNDNLHLVWWNAGSPKVCMYRYKPNGGSWSGYSSIPTTGNGCQVYDVAVDSNDVLHLAFHIGDHNGTARNVYHIQRNTNGTWSGQTKISNCTGDNEHCAWPIIETYGTDVHVAYCHTNAWPNGCDVYHTSRVNGSWQSTTVLTNNSSIHSRVSPDSMEFDSTGNLYLCWHDEYSNGNDNDITCKLNTNGTWSTQAPLSTHVRRQWPAVIVDDENIAHLMYSELVSPSWDIMESTND